MDCDLSNNHLFSLNSGCWKPEARVPARSNKNTLWVQMDSSPLCLSQKMEKEAGR